MNVVTFNKPNVIRMECSKCGTQQTAGCSCGVRYVPVKPGVAAREAIARSPGRSSRVIAKEAGVSRQTVDRERSGSNGPVETRKDARGSMRVVKSKRVSGSVNAEVNAISREAPAFLQIFEPRFREFVESNPDLPDGAKVSLSNSLRVCAETLMELAALVGD